MPRGKPKKPCGAKTRAGGQCGRPAGAGTDHVGAGRCSLHGGSTPNGKKAAQTEVARSIVEALRIENPPSVSPVQALERELARQAVLVDAIRRRLVVDFAADEAGLLWGVTGETVTIGEDTEVKTTRAAVPAALWQVYREERAYLVKLATALGGLVPAGVDLGQDAAVEETVGRLLQPGSPLAPLLHFPARAV